MAPWAWLGIGALAIGLVLLVLSGDSGTVFGMRDETFARTLYLGVLGAVLASFIVASRMRMGQVARNLAIWVLIVLVLVAGYQYRYELQDFANRVTVGLVPGSPLSGTGPDGVFVQIDRLASGHFEVRGQVDDTPVSFLIDTGATITVLSARDAEAVGIDMAALDFSVSVMTANGPARAARTGIREIRIGTIARGPMPVLVSQPGALGQSLLGMNFLRTLSGFEVRGDRMILRD